MTQRRDLNAERNIGFSATVSARALRKLAERLFPPSGSPSAHRDKLIAARRRPNDLYACRRGDVLAGREIAGLAD